MLNKNIIFLVQHRFYFPFLCLLYLFPFPSEPLTLFWLPSTSPYLWILAAQRNILYKHTFFFPTNLYNFAYIHISKFCAVWNVGKVYAFRFPAYAQLSLTFYCSQFSLSLPLSLPANGVATQRSWETFVIFKLQFSFFKASSRVLSFASRLIRRFIIIVINFSYFGFCKCLLSLRVLTFTQDSFLLRECELLCAT